jgi:two-component system, cell cycle response regulator CtrA
MRVLVIDSDASASGEGPASVLLGNGFKVEFTDSGEEGLDMAKLYDFDAIALDLMLPDTTGFDVLRRLRDAKVKTPVLIVSGMALVTDIVKALKSGADDYLTKPCHPDELIARLHALVRRSKGLAESVVNVGNLSLDLATKTLKVDGNALYLTGKEYQMIELLSLRKGVTQSKDAFMTHLYGGRDEPELKIIDVFICKLRKKLAAVNGHPIETVWGRGYVLREAVGGKPVSMVAEVADITDNPPVHVSKMTFQEYDRLPKEAKGRHARA